MGPKTLFSLFRPLLYSTLIAALIWNPQRNPIPTILVLSWTLRNLVFRLRWRGQGVRTQEACVGLRGSKGSWFRVRVLKVDGIGSPKP